MAARTTSLPTLAKEQVKAISECLFEGFFGDNAPQGVYGTETGIKHDREIIIFGKHTGLSGSAISDCTRTPNTGWTIPSTNKLWAPKYIGDSFEECFADYMTNFWKYSLKAGVEKDDLTGTDLAAYITMHLEDTIKDVVLRHAYFGDTGIVVGTGNNLSGSQDDYFNVIDGFFKQLFAIVAGTAARLSTTDLTTKNAAATFALQKFDSTDTTNQVVTNALDLMNYDADMRLRGMEKSKLIFKVTQSVYDQYERERKATGGGAILEVFQRQEKGTPNLSSNGIEIVPMPFWDRMIQTYFGDDATPTSWVLPHRAVLTTRDNFRIGTEDTKSLGNFDTFHDKYHKVMVTDYGFMLDAKILLNNMVQAAY